MRKNRGEQYEVAGSGLVVPAPAFACKECGQLFWKEEDAKRCASAPSSTTLANGTIVIVSTGRTWFEGDPAWVIEPADGYEFHKKTTYRIYFVLGSTNLHPPYASKVLDSGYGTHQLRYSLFSRAVKLTNGQVYGGWTAPMTHFGFEVPKNQDELRERLGDLSWAIGLKTEHLL